MAEGDIIIGFNGHTISGIDDIHRELTEERVGVETELTLIRQGEKIVLKITPEESRPRTNDEFEVLKR